MADTSTPSKPYVLLVALDLAGDSPGALSHALELARAHANVEVHVLSVVPPVGIVIPETGAFGDAPIQDALDRLKQFAAVQLGEAITREPYRSGHAPRVQIHATLGTPAAEILWLAAHVDADLIVVGTHSRKGVRRLLLGSVAERVARLAGCPVMVVRDKHHDAPWRIPEMEPICEDCAAARAKSSGRDLWCARHAAHHIRAHVVCQAPHERGPSPVESVTGV